jgi:hypothetical protein
MNFTFIMRYVFSPPQTTTPFALTTRDEPRVRPKRVNIRMGRFRDQISAVADSGRRQCVQRIADPVSVAMKKSPLVAR